MTKILTTTDGLTLRVRGHSLAEQTANAIYQVENLVATKKTKITTLMEFIVANVQTDSASLGVAEDMLGDEAAWSLRTSGCWV